MEKNSVVLYKSGKFYNAFGDHGLILHHLVGYKYVEYKQSVGFPESAYNKVINILQENKISYRVYEKERLVEQAKGISKNYMNVLKNALKEMDLEKRMNRIKLRIDNFSIDELERIIEGIECGSSK